MQYAIPDIRNVEYLGGAGGFSGAQIWKVSTSTNVFCLRRWPFSHPDRERLDWINLVLAHANDSGCPFIATPIESRSGRRYVQSSGYFWELAPWMPGVANFEQDPNDLRLENVMSCLATFHLASAQVNLGFQNSENSATRCLALENAGQLIEEVREADAARPSECIEHLRRIIIGMGGQHARQLAGTLKPFTREVFPVQPVIRDVWHDHLLFTGDELTGIVDFGAMQIDNVALDLSRVLGSLLGDQTARWQTAFDAYSKIRQLSSKEVDLILALDRTAAFLSGLNWLRWIFLEGRRFESEEHVEERIRLLIGRLVD